jgi:hypothetical protein
MIWLQASCRHFFACPERNGVHVASILKYLLGFMLFGDSGHDRVMPVCMVSAELGSIRISVEVSHFVSQRVVAEGAKGESA